MERPSLFKIMIYILQKKPNRKYSLILAVSIVLLSSCTANIHIPYESQLHSSGNRTSTEKTANFAGELFSYSKRPLEYVNHDQTYKVRRARGKKMHWIDVDIADGYHLKKIQFPAVRNNGQDGNLVRIRYYKHISEGRKPLIIVLPIYGSHTYPSEKITQGLKSINPTVNIALLEYERHLIDLEGLAAAQTVTEARQIMADIRDKIIAGVIDVKRVIDWAYQRQEIDENQIMLVTFSMSALVGILSTQHESRLHGSVIVMGAANPHEVLTVCGGRPMMARTALQKRFGWSDDQYRKLLHQYLQVLDPVNYVSVANPEKLLMIDAYKDDCMPQSTRDALWESLGRPERISYLYAHKKAFLSMTPLGFNTMRRRIYNFIEKNLEVNGQNDT